MTHEWKDFHPDDGPLLPLSSGQQAPPVSGVLPSGEAHFFDYRQDRSVNPTVRSDNGSGINYPFPHPNPDTPNQEKFLSRENPSGLDDKFTKEWWDASGILKTYPESPNSGFYDSAYKSTIFSPTGDKVPFSNGRDIKFTQIDDFAVFNHYVHHYRLNSPSAPPITIPYISQYFISTMKQIEGFSADFDAPPVDQDEEGRDDD